MSLSGSTELVPSSVTVSPLSNHTVSSGVITWSEPASATGAWTWETVVSTVIITVSIAEKPSSSVIFNWKRWIPFDRFFTMDLGKAESTIEDEAGPEILDHKYPLIVPSGSFDKLPSSE